MVFEEFKYKYEDIDADMAELGVYTGNTAVEIASVFPYHTLHLFDTFTGHPDIICEEDFDERGQHHEAGAYSNTSVEDVKKRFGGNGDVRLYQGLFADTCKRVADKRFCLVHLDADLYESTRQALEFFYPRVIKGGAIIIHDYGPNPKACPGIRAAVDRFLRNVPERLDRADDTSYVYIEKQ